MRRVIQAIPNAISNNNNFANKPLYTRFHRKPQIYQTNYQPNYQTNYTYKVENQDKLNNYITNIYKEKKYRGVLDPAAPNNKNIFIDTDSEYHKTDRDLGKLAQKEKKSTQLLIAKTESQYPDTYNSENIFKRDGLIKGYYIKFKDNNNNLNQNTYNKYNTLTKNSRKIKTIINTPSPEQDIIYKYDYNKTTENHNNNRKNYVNQTYNRNTLNKGFFKKEIDLDEWPSKENTHKAKLYYRNKDIQLGDRDLIIDNSNNIDNDNINQNRYQKNYQIQNRQNPSGIYYRRGNLQEMKGSFSKSNISDISEDFIGQYKKIPIENNYYIAGNVSGTGSPNAYKSNNYILGTSDEESDHQNDLRILNEGEYQNYRNNRIIRKNINDIENDDNYIEFEHGGKVNLNYGIMNKNKDIKTQNIYNYIINSIKNDKFKLNQLIKLQKYIKSYLYLREICAMKIQAVWRGGNTRRIMDLYNDLDEFIYHLSKVQFNHFNNNFCFFIKQLFNIYKANISNENLLDNEEEIENIGNNEELENIENNEEAENENCMNQITLEEMEKKDGSGEYLYKYPEGSYFEPEKLELENEIALFVEASSPYERKNEKKSKEYERLLKDYDELYQQYTELKENNNRFVPKLEKNESESAIGSNKIHKIKRQNLDTGRNLTISNDYDADLDINRDDDFFNQEISYDDKDNNGSLIKDKRYSYFSIHSDENNSKYFDNENPKEKENKEGEIFKINTSKNSGGSRYNNNSTKNTGYTGYTGYSTLRDKYKFNDLQKTEKINKNDTANSPSLEKSNNYIGHHSKTFPRKYKNYNYSINSTLIIPRHEEDFNIINNKLFLSPKDREVKMHIKNNRSDIAITPGIQFDDKEKEKEKDKDKNWNEIMEYIKNEGIEIPIKKNNYKTFDILETEKNNEINIDNKDYRNKKLSQMYIEHENELNIIKIKSKKDIEKENNLIKSIEEKDNQIILIKQQLEELSNKIKEAKMFNSKLEINNNLNTLDIIGLKPKKTILDKINIDNINIYRKPKEIISTISKNNEFSIYQLKIIPETNEECTDTADLKPKEIKITTKKIVKKTDTIGHRFKNNLISSENAININGKEKRKPIFEEESQENNRFSVDKTIKEKEKENEIVLNQNKYTIKDKDTKDIADNQIEDNKENENENIVYKYKILNPEDLKVIQSITYNISSLEEIKDKKEDKKEIFYVVKNNEISLNPINKREIKIVTKKVLKKTNVIHSKFNDNKTVISTQNQLDIKGIEKQPEIKEVIKEKIVESPIQKQLSDWKNNEITKENNINLNGIGKKFDNIQLQKEDDKNNNRFCIENDLEVPIIYKKQTIPENIINKKSHFTINGIKKKPEENVMNAKAKFTIKGTQKEPIKVEEEGIQYETNTDDLCEKMTDTNDLIPKEIKITTKKTVKKTNILKKNNNLIISKKDEIKMEGFEKPEEEEKKEDKKENEEIKSRDWNKLLKKDGQQYNFVIKRISKNIYKKYQELKDIQEKEKSKKEEDKKEQEKIDTNKDIENDEKEKTYIQPNEKITTIEKRIEKDWNKLITQDNPQNITIERNINYIPKPKENIIVRKINFNILDNKDIPKKDIEKAETKEEELISGEKEKEKIIYQNIDWKDIVKEDIQQSKFIIKGIKKKINLDNKKQIDIEKNIEFNFEPTEVLPLSKNKVMENWNESNLEQKSEIINIENQKKKEIKITTRKITKKTNNIYKKFNNLTVSQNVFNINGKHTPKMNSKDYKTENINLNIDKSYQKKIIKDFDIEKNKELFINANEYKKKEIKITTKKKVAKVNYVYKRFNNNTISKENIFNIDGDKTKSTIISSFGNEKLEKVEIKENNFTIDKIIDNKKEEELKEKLQKEAENQLEIKLQKEKEEFQKILENKNNENNDLIKENEELKNKIKLQNEIEIKKDKEKQEIEKKLIEEENKQNTFVNILPIATEEFTLEMENNSEEESKIIGFNDEALDIDNIQFSFCSIPKEVSEQGIQIEEEKSKKEEKDTDTFDLEKKEIKITHKKILKKTNVLRHEFRNNSICSDTRININKTNNLKDRNNNIINKIKCFTIDQKEKCKDTDIDKSEKNKVDVLKINNKENIDNRNFKYRNIDNKNINNNIDNIQLGDEQMQKPKESNITEKAFGDNNQLSNVKLHKTKRIITDDDSKLASNDNIINLDIKENEKVDEDDKRLYKRRKVMNLNYLYKPPNKKKKFATLIINLDNKFDLKNSFNKWNTIIPIINDKDKNNTINIKQVMKEKNKNIKENLKINTIDNNKERITDTTTNIEKSIEDLNTNTIPIKTIYNNNTTNNNFETINLEDKIISSIEEHPSSINVIDDNENKKKILKIKKNKKNIDSENTDDKVNKDNEEIINIDNIINNKRKSIQSHSSNDLNENNNLNSISNDVSSSIEINDKSEKSSGDNKNDQENSEKQEEPKKKEILIKKKICIFSKKPKVIKYAEAKKKFLKKRFFIKFWKIWKKNTFHKESKEKVIGSETGGKHEMKSLEPKSTKKPFSFKSKKIHKRIVDANNDEDNKKKFLSLKNNLLNQNKDLIIRHFFFKWNKDIVHESNEFKGISIIENILRRHIVRYLVMHGKFYKFKKLLMKYALIRRHK